MQKSSKSIGAFVLHHTIYGKPLKKRLFGYIRQVMIWIADPHIDFRVHGRVLRMPLSHQLPVYSAAHPEYDRALGRIASAISRFRSHCTAVDVGANIGDSARLILETPNSTVLCIEGDSEYAGLIRNNLHNHEGRYRVILAYIGSGEIEWTTPEKHKGTARLVPGASNRRLTFLSLEDAAEQTGLDQVDLLKIDTDGLDIRIIRDSKLFLMQHMPVIFFEFYPDLFRVTDQDGYEIFSELRQMGYRNGICYANTGEILGGFSLEISASLDEKLRFFRLSRSIVYLDFCVFGDETEYNFVLDAEISSVERIVSQGE